MKSFTVFATLLLVTLAFASPLTRDIVEDEEYIISVRKEVLEAFNRALSSVDTRVLMLTAMLATAGHKSTQDCIRSTEYYTNMLFALQNDDKPSVLDCIQTGIDKVNYKNDLQQYYINYYMNLQSKAAHNVANNIIDEMNESEKNIQQVYNDFKSCFDESCRQQEKMKAETIQRYVKNGGIETTSDLMFDLDEVQKSLDTFNHREHMYFEKDLQEIYRNTNQCVDEQHA